MPVNQRFMAFSNTLIKWYLQNKRELPWRDTVDPYLIWLSEIMLQQTRVAQGLPFYLKFVNAFPTVFDLANASEEQVLKLWQGLGYYSRARNLHKAAKIVAFDFNGQFPDGYFALLKLPGIGDYTAAAIASFSYNEPVAVVDGNVYRVLSRYFEVETDIASSAAKAEFRALAQQLMPHNDPATFNQAIMEFGALQCVPQNPDCASCVLNDGCAALQKNKVHLLPVKSKKAKVRNRYFNYLVIQDEHNRTLVQKRIGKGIWENLYEFPLVESEYERSDLVLRHIVCENEIESIYELNQHNVVHKLSHQHLHVKFWKVDVKGQVVNGLSASQLKALPFPIVLFNFIEKHWQ